MTLLQCPICEYKQDNSNFKILETDCIFTPIEEIDQHLVRYKCANCGVIFGSLQMLGLSKAQLGEAYRKLFESGYRDGNDITLEYEMNDLLALNPTPNGVYLNWGAQVSLASEKAKELGYTLLSFDPFMIGEPPPNSITMEQAMEMKFDGIISHNLLEHLQDPVAELKLMKSLLKPGCNMVHSTGCYSYCYEQTKYHLFFFEGISIYLICKQAGLRFKYLDDITIMYMPI